MIFIFLEICTPFALLSDERSSLGMPEPMLSADDDCEVLTFFLSLRPDLTSSWASGSDVQRYMESTSR